MINSFLRNFHTCCLSNIFSFCIMSAALIASILFSKIYPDPGAPAPKTLKILFSTLSLFTKFVSNLDRTGVFKIEILIPNKKDVIKVKNFFLMFFSKQIA